MRLQAEFCVSVETTRVTKAIFPKDNIYLTVADSLGSFPAERDASQLISPQKATSNASIPASVGNNYAVCRGLTDRQTALFFFKER